MKRLLVPGWLLVAVGLGCFQPGIARAQESPGVDAAAAARSYDEGDYEAAGVLYRRLLEEAAEGVDRAALHYNLGNAEYRAGRLGYAMLHWERSLALHPGDGDARANLGLAHDLLDRRLTEAAASGASDTFSLELLRSMQGFGAWLRRSSPGRLAWVLSASALLAGALWTLLMLGRGRRRLVVAGLGLVLLAAAASGALLRLRVTAPPVAVVVQPGAALRSGPGHSFPQLAALPEGFYLELDDESSASQDGFRRVMAAGIVGYADSETVIPVSDR